MDMKAFLTQNLSPVALLVFEINVTKFPSEKWNKSSNSVIYPRKMGLALKKLVFIVLLDPKLTSPMSISAISKQRKIVSSCKFLGPLDEKRAAATPTPRLINFAKIWSEHVLKINTESHNIWAS